MSRTAVEELARAHGVAVEYRDAAGARTTVDTEALLGVLRALGLPVRGAADAARIRRAGASPRDPIIEPVVVIWQGRPADVVVRPRLDAEHVDVELEGEAGDGPRWAGRVPVQHTGPRSTIRLAGVPPLGYHRLRVAVGGDDGEALLVSAPSVVPDPVPPRVWGVFAPLFSLWRAPQELPDVGLLDDLGALTSRFGASLVATLPLLAAFLDEPAEPSPYRPVSRRYWNEAYVDLGDIPELAGEAAPRRDQAGRDVDLTAVMAVKRPFLELAARRLHEGTGRRREAFETWRDAHGEIAEYARFRARVEAHGVDRRTWPDDVDPGRTRYHEYVQFVAHEQMTGLTRRLAARAQWLYLDLPIGTHPDGFDVFVAPGEFASGATVGAPPDAFFADGQDWGFPPPHPTGARRHGYRDLRLTLAHQLHHAGMLRLDHVMGLHRLWWVPDGAPATAGAYVHSRAEELFAIVCLEAHRHGAAVAGEDLGTVADEVRDALTRHRIRRSYVGQFEMDPSRDPVLQPAPTGSVASLATHDTATFAGLWSEADVDERVDLGLESAADAARERAGRQDVRTALAREVSGDPAAPDPGPDDAGACRAVVRHLLVDLAAGDADVVVVSIDDLTLERAAQNVPGTTADVRSNFCRRAAVPVGDLGRDAPAELLAAVGAARPAARAEGAA